MNQVSLIGRVARMVDLKTANGNVCVNNAIAVQNIYKSKEEKGADFYPIVAWGKLAERMAKYVKKGDRIGLLGRLKNRRYTNKEGQTVYVTEIIMEEIFFLESSPEKKESWNFDEVFADPVG